MVEEAVKNKCKTIAYTYSEPVAFYEYMFDTAKLAQEQKIKNVLVSNGYINEKPLRELCRYTDAINLDIKAFDDEFYRKVCGATLAPVLAGLKVMQEEGVWVELTNLVVPTLNDNLDTIRRLCGWIAANAGTEVPLHFSRFQPMYQLTGLPPTPAQTLLAAREAARAEGLKFVYIGNVETPGGGDTVCPGCGRTIIRRAGFQVLEMNLKDGNCGGCGRKIPGIWAK